MSGLPAYQRLSKTTEISSVLNFKCRASGEQLSVLAKPSALTYSRMTVISPKKISAHAVTRNYHKRLLRSLFYQQQALLSATYADLVFMVKKPFDKAAHVKVSAEVHTLLCLLNKKLERCCEIPRH